MLTINTSTFTLGIIASNEATRIAVKQQSNKNKLIPKSGFLYVLFMNYNQFIYYSLY